MNDRFSQYLEETLSQERAAGLYKHECQLLSAQGSRITIASPPTIFVGLKPADQRVRSVQVLNFCANNYLGLSGDYEVIEAAHKALDRWGFGLSSVRFICGTQAIHSELESKLTSFLGTDDTLLYSSCFDANGGVFESLFGTEDAIISDELNHASLIDGIRLCKAARFRYRNCDMGDLEKKLRDSTGSRFKIIVTDGVFSMDGIVAPLREICHLAEQHGALVMVDDSHAVGFMGKTGRGTHEHCGVVGRIDILTGTLGKALGGASGGYVSGQKGIIELLRQRSRPYLFSNSLAPAIVGASLKALDLVTRDTSLRDKLESNTTYFRTGLANAGFEIRPGCHPIVPVILGDARISQEFASRLLALGIYATAFAYPVVPKGSARIRVQVSALHSQEDLDFAIFAFEKVYGEMLGTGNNCAHSRASL